MVIFIRTIGKHQPIYSLLFFSSLLLFLINFLIQNQIVFTYSDFYGILFKMNWLYWLGYFVLLVLIYFHFVKFSRIDSKFVYLSFLLLSMYLIGTPSFYEHLPRFEDTWVHSFLAQEMFKTGRVVNRISPYEDYPGSFLFFGLLFQVLPSYSVMKFFVPLIYVLGISTVYLIFKYLFNEKISFLASVMYVFFNWTVEDNHISPQFLILHVYFLFMLVLIKLLRERKENKKPYFFFAILFIPVIVFSHPGTPIFLILILGSIFFVCEKLRSRLFLTVIIFLSVCFLAYNIYQSSSLNSYLIYFKEFLRLFLHGEFVGMTQRFYTTLPSRQVFLGSRVGMTVFSVVFGLLGIFIMYRKNYVTGAKFFLAWAFSMIIFSVFVGLVLKGEFYERFVLISSLPLAAASAYLLCELRFSGWLILVFLLLLSSMYFIAKYGNEGFESISSEKLMADCFSNNFYSDCEQKREIVVIPLNYDLKNFGASYFTVSREDIMAGSVYLDKDLKDVVNLVDKISSDTRLDKIYSTDTAGVYR